MGRLGLRVRPRFQYREESRSADLAKDLKPDITRVLSARSSRNSRINADNAFVVSYADAMPATQGKAPP